MTDDGLAREIEGLVVEMREMAARGEHAHMLTLLPWADRLAVLSRRSLPHKAGCPALRPIPECDCGAETSGRSLPPEQEQDRA
jgi:hypothetical protein